MKLTRRELLKTLGALAAVPLLPKLPKPKPAPKPSPESLAPIRYHDPSMVITLFRAAEKISKGEVTWLSSTEGTVCGTVCTKAFAQRAGGLSSLRPIGIAMQNAQPGDEVQVMIAGVALHFPGEVRAV